MRFPGVRALESMHLGRSPADRVVREVKTLRFALESRPQVVSRAAL